jgi:hypothetical protein
MAEEGSPRSAARLEAWLELEEGSGARAERVLTAIGDRSGGEEAALALARWMARPDAGEIEVSGAPGDALSDAVIALVRARNAAMEGDAMGARGNLDAIPPGALPLAWEDLAGRVRGALGDEGAVLADEAVNGYRDAAQRFLGRRDQDAGPLLDRWLAEWPDSPLRPNALLLRAQLRLAAGQTDGASGDLLAAERLGRGPDAAERAALLRAFLQAQLGGHDDAQSSFSRARDGELGRSAAGELGFDAVRLARLAGDRAGADALILRLEEAFPEEPWAVRARNDTDAARWKEPWRSLPAEPGFAARLDPPDEGPWHRLLWGDAFLAREANVLEGAVPSPVLATLETPSVEPMAPAYPTTVSDEPLAFVDLGIGAPAALLAGGGVAGLVHGLHYRGDFAKTIAQERNDLPDYRRTDWEAGLAVDPGKWKIGGVAEGTARTDDDAPRLGLSPDPIDASWWGVRGDLLGGDPERSGVAASIARIGGEVDARSEGRWKTDQTWYALRAALPIGGVAWTAQTTWGDLELSEPGANRTGNGSATCG